MRSDRVADDIYIFKSDLYIQVVSTVLLTDEGAIVVDTLPFPQETVELRRFVDEKLGAGRVRYVVETHHHPDHVYGAYMFPEAEVISHSRCRQILARRGSAMLAQAKRDTPALAEVKLVVPGLTFERELDVSVAHRHLQLAHAPGHSADGISLFVLGEKILVAGDTLMPVPHIIEGDLAAMRVTLKRFLALRPSVVIQGHGDVLLRGEVKEAIDANLAYLDAIELRVRQHVEAQRPPSELKLIEIEACGLSRIPLDGWVGRIHTSNLVALYKRMTQAA